MFGAGGDEAVVTVGNTNEDGFTDSAGFAMGAVDEGNENAGTVVENWLVESEAAGGTANEDGVDGFASITVVGFSGLTAPVGGAVAGGTEGAGVPIGVAAFFSASACF